MMATGDQADMVSRIRAVLPAGWFPVTAQGETSSTPFLDGVLASPGSVWAFSYSLLQYVVTQTRIATATGVWLDIIAQDFFANYLSRRPGEADNPFRTRITNELFRPKGTRPGLIQALTQLGCPSVIVFVPGFLGDTGAWDTNTMGWDVAGAWGETDLPFQFFLTVRRPVGVAAGGVDGWDGPVGGWDVGALEWTDPSLFGGQITDATILAVINDVIPSGYVAWTNITN